MAIWAPETWSDEHASLLVSRSKPDRWGEMFVVGVAAASPSPALVMGDYALTSWPAQSAQTWPSKALSDVGA